MSIKIRLGDCTVLSFSMSSKEAERKIRVSESAAILLFEYL